LTAPAKPRTNTPPHPHPGTGTSAARPRGAATPAGGQPGPRSEFADDPFIRRLADPATAEREVRSRRDIVDGLKVLKTQREKLTIADAYYDGDVGMVYASQQVRRLLAKQGVEEDDVQDFNYARIPVDAIAERLQIAAIKIAPLVDEDDAEDEGDEDDDADGDSGEATADPKTIKRAERAVKTIRKNNRLDVYEKSLHKTLCRHGEAYLFLWPVTTGDDQVSAGPGGLGNAVSVDFRVNDGHTVAFVYDTEDPLRVSYVIKSWQVASEQPDPEAGGEGRNMVIRANLYYPGPQQIDRDGVMTQGAGHVERWVTKPGAQPERPDSWIRVQDLDVEPDNLAEVAADEFTDPDDFDAEEFGAQAAGSGLARGDIPSPFGLTWFHFRNDVPGGRPEHEAAYGPQTLINKLVWSYAGVIEYQGFPQRYIMVDPKIDDPLLNDIDPDHGELEDDDPEAEGATSGLKSDPGSVWRLFGKSTGEYSASDPATFMVPLDRFIKSMAELTDVPAYKFTKATGDMPSGQSFREANRSYDAKVKDRQDRADPEWQDAYEQALRMMGIGGVSVDVRWTPINQVDDLDGVNVLKAKAELGVPSEVLLNEAGYPDELVAQWLGNQEGLSLPQRVALLVQLGTAVQALSAGVTAGVVSDNQTQAFISRIIGNLAEGTADTDDEGGDALPKPTFREPPPTNPAMAAVEASTKDPLKQAQVEATKATAETSRASAEMMRAGAGAPPRKTTPAKKAAPRTKTATKAARPAAARG
jgi:hypothetical protein